MTPDEVAIIEKKYASKRICEMNPAEVLAKVIAVITRIHVITGWTIPDDKEYIRILAEELKEKLTEDFSQMNFDEIIHAFRSIGTGIKDWGKSMNIALVDEVLKEYAFKRFELSQQEEKLKVAPEQRIYTKIELTNIQRADIEAFYQRCLKGIIPPLELPDYFKEVLVEDGLMKENDDLHGFFSLKINNGVKNIYERAV